MLYGRVMARHVGRITFGDQRADMSRIAQASVHRGVTAAVGRSTALAICEADSNVAARRKVIRTPAHLREQLSWCNR